LGASRTCPEERGTGANGAQVGAGSGDSQATGSGGSPSNDANSSGNSTAWNAARDDVAVPSNQTPGQQEQTDAITQQIMRNRQPGVLHFYDDQEDMPDVMTRLALPSLIVDQGMQSVDYGDTMFVANLLPIYEGYTITPGQNGSSVIQYGTSQIEVPTSVMTVPSTQIEVPSPVMTVPSNQVTPPTSNTRSASPEPMLCGR
jgi:hypothetical protein